MSDSAVLTTAMSSMSIAVAAHTSVIEVWDSPPAWFDVPALDLRMLLLVLQALRGPVVEHRPQPTVQIGELLGGRPFRAVRHLPLRGPIGRVIVPRPVAVMPRVTMVVVHQ